MPSYFNFIDKFVRSGHPNREQVLMQLLVRDDHDRMTYQKCVEHLGELKTASATDRIEELFERPPFGTQDAIFQSKCLKALHKILGADALPFFKETSKREQYEIVRTTLEALIKQTKPKGSD